MGDSALVLWDCPCPSSSRALMAMGQGAVGLHGIVHHVCMWSQPVAIIGPGCCRATWYSALWVHAVPACGDNCGRTEGASHGIMARLALWQGEACLLICKLPFVSQPFFFLYLLAAGRIPSSLAPAELHSSVVATAVAGRCSCQT